MDTPVSRILDAITAEPWLITQQGLEQVCAVARREGEDLQALAARLGRPLENARDVEVRGGVAIIPVRGPLFRYANVFSQVSGATSTELLAKDFAIAQDNPNVERIVLDIDSPGGQASGISEFAAMIRLASKPVTAYVGGTGASAAYWIASAAGRVVASDTALLGSIGVVGAFKADASDTIKIISSQSPLKQADPATEAGRAESQRVIDDLAAVFVSAVAEQRGVSEETVLTEFGRGGVLVGAKAVAAGMADDIGTLETVLGGKAPAGQPMIGAAQPGLKSISNPSKEANTMSIDELEKHVLAGDLDDYAVEARVKETWSQHRSMRDEFRELDTAVSYFQAVARGRVRRLAATVRG